MAGELDIDFLQDLLDSPQEQEETVNNGLYPLPAQKGPLRYNEDERPCVNLTGKTTCGSPTHWRVQSVPRCMVHALYRLNELLIEKGVS
jgi:hypothetical protein